MATQKDQVYECRDCGNVVKIVEPGDGLLYCCDSPMMIKQEKKKTSADFMQSFGGDFKGRTLQ
ncbi:MAG: desulfoferrodoxin FeS4 iron-binding domain-containing protein [Clostridia bacterium]|nr:desulfoferrodoxin FeS4 iron-binding domain-containing protein [Clostridia bacterium]